MKLYLYLEFICNVFKRNRAGGGGVYSENTFFPGTTDTAITCPPTQQPADISSLSFSLFSLLHSEAA